MSANPKLWTRIDSFLGAHVERQVVAHHRRRLTRLGHERALHATHGWAMSAGAPWPGNELDVLVDGAEALAEIATAIESARSSVWLAGWFFSPDFRLRSDSEITLRDVLADRAARLDVRLLAWAGAPLPLFHPDRSEVQEMRDAFASGTQIRVALDSRERPLHCHHEKLVIVDGMVAFVGGIDLTSYAGDRLDGDEHPARGSLGWHDAATRITGPAVAGVAEHFRLRWHEVTGEQLPEPPTPPATGATEVQIVRTVPEKIYDALPRGEFSILESYLAALRSAERLIYLENQFLWSPEIVEVLEDKLRNHPDERFRLLLLLPAKPNNGADDTRGQTRTARSRRLRRARALPRVHPPSTRRRREARLRSREDRHRRRPVAHDRLGEPQRALALQRHGDERRLRRPRNRAHDAASPLERAPRMLHRRGRR